MPNDKTTTQTSERLIPKPELKAQLGNPSDTTIWRLVKSHGLPPPVRVSPGRVMWIQREVDEWIAAKSAERSSKAA